MRDQLENFAFCVFPRLLGKSWFDHFYHLGGAILVQSSGTSVNVYGTSFNGNTADSGNGNDIYKLTDFDMGMKNQILF